MSLLWVRPTAVFFLFPYMGLSDGTTDLYIGSIDPFYSLIWDCDFMNPLIQLLEFLSFYSLIWDYFRTLQRQPRTPKVLPDFLFPYMGF